LTAAKGVTTKIFAGIGVRIHWALGTPRQTDGAAIAMQFDSEASARFRSDALAYATPFDDSHTSIHIFYGRVLGTVPRKLGAPCSATSWRTRSRTSWSTGTGTPQPAY
jgi:hypothetical protein